MEDIPVTNGARGEPESIKENVMETGAAMVQSFAPTQRICAHLHGFHAYFDAPHIVSEAHHYCAHVNEEVRQCILYDSGAANARLIGVEYMISPRLYAQLDVAERRLWHSHVFEVKSGMLVMPGPPAVPEPAWRQVENLEMKELITLYGKVWNLWQVAKGHDLPIGKPELMVSFTSPTQLDIPATVAARDATFGIDTATKAESRAGIHEPDVHPDADDAWQRGDAGAGGGVESEL